MGGQTKAVGDDHVNFYVEKCIHVKAVPLSKAMYVPRVGERLRLPGMKEGGAGDYEVERVVYYYDSAEEDPLGVGAVELAQVSVHLKAVCVANG
jgi:hypothetical protein